MSPVTIGVEIELVDELPPVVAPTATDPAFLFHSAADELVTVRTASDARDAFTGEAALIALTDAFFGEGGARLTVVPLTITSGTPNIAAATALVPADLGPGQVIAPEVVTGTAIAALANWAYDTNRVYIADGPDGATDAALTTLAGTLAAATGARFAGLEADTLVIPGLSGGTTREVPASVVKAAIIARNDVATENPNLAAAGITNARCRYVLGIADERTQAERDALADAGVNTFKSLYGAAVVPYGYRVTQTALPLWWDMSGSRVTMAIRAREAAVAETFMFGQIDGAGAFLSAYETALAANMKDLQRLGALFGSGPADPGYSVSAGWDVNPRADVAAGMVRSRIRYRTSPFTEHAGLSIIRRPITSEV